jgi:hypothetical protein
MHRVGWSATFDVVLTGDVDVVHCFVGHAMNDLVETWANAVATSRVLTDNKYRICMIGCSRQEKVLWSGTMKQDRI